MVNNASLSLKLDTTLLNENSAFPESTMSSDSQTEQQTENNELPTNIQSEQTLQLSHDLWIHICKYLEPIDRIQLCQTSLYLNQLLKQSSYPVVPFYSSDLNYWLDNIQWILTPIKTKRSKNLPLFGLNLYQFDSMNFDVLLNIKYFIIFYDKICSIRINKKIEKAQHLLKLKDQTENAMARLSDDEYNETGESLFDINNMTEKEEEEAKLIETELEQLELTQDELENLTDFIPTTIEHIYLHELENKDQNCMEYIIDCIKYCSNNCGIFHDLHFDKSNLNNESVNKLCNGFMQRNDTFDCLRNIFFHGNFLINDQCIDKLLVTLCQKCPNLRFIDLTQTGITNRTCHIIHEFYVKLLDVENENELNNIKTKIPKWEYIDLSSNQKIDIHGIDIINDIYIKYGQFDIKNNCDIKLSVEIDVGNCNWSTSRIGWSQHIRYDI